MNRPFFDDRRRFIAQLLLLPLAIVAALGAALFGAVSGKEGIGDLGVWTGILGVLALMLTGWHLVRSRTRWGARLHWIGVAILGLPLLIYFLVLGYMGFVWVGGRWAMTRATITAYHETPIHWPGIADPVGVRVDITVSVPFRLPGIFHPPKIFALPRGSEIDGRSLSLCYGAHEQYACLTEPIGLLRSPAVIADPAATRLSFELYPSSILYLDPQRNRVCLSDQTAGRDGFDEQRVVWWFATAAEMLDFGALLQTASTTTQWLKAANVIKLERALSPAAFEQWGYRPCPPPTDTDRHCYCR